MTAAARDVLDAFERLPEIDRLGLAAEILRRTAEHDLMPLGDEDLALVADELFQRLDDCETADGRP